MKKIYIILLIFLLILNSCNKEEEILETTRVSPKIKKEINKNINQIIYKTGETISSNNSLSGSIKAGTDIENLINTQNTQTETIIKNTTQKEIIKIGDESITKFVNDKVHFSKLNYTPLDLVPLKGEYIIDTKGNQVLRNEANKYLQELANDFYKEFNVKLKVVSAYRSYYYQKQIKDRGCSDIFCAKPGYSEHQSGLAVDLFETTSKDEFLAKKDLKKYFDWLKKNAYKYGFHNSYRNGIEIDGYAIEPWHWRYVGVHFATELQQKDITYAEYYLKYGEKK